MRMIAPLVFAAMLSSTAVQAQAGLKNEDDINHGLLIVAVAEKINRACDSIGVRVFAARGYVNDLKDIARERGYSEKEIRSYLNNKQNKAEMRERRNAFYKSRGASNLDHASLCKLGHGEIKKNSQIGVLLRAK
ncbi:hypothetical protein ROA7450_02465 [Roseovarius albus]|uniref:NADH dehydrogenase subunit E n=1 Tax=Roseovarius albus TaxID=1247867 RepID=A0A1X6ZFH3_9RHOB|nr:DUF5333 domain-containing protein [Roseovarius albus]SLN49945.1 hypothetical protein ROA7450_02465 [Roseovarius albus]